MCIAPTITKTDVIASAVVNVANTDITKARFTLRKNSDNSIVGGPTVVNRIGTTVSSGDFTGLVTSTGYYFQIELYANNQGAEVISSQTGYLESVCGPYPFTTNAPAGCNPVTSFTLVAREVL